MTTTIYQADCRDILKTLESGSVQTVVTSPPYYGLRDYGVDGQIGLEKGPKEFIQEMVDLFREVRRVLRDDGTLWLNFGDSYARTGGFDTKVHENARVSNQRNSTRPKKRQIAPAGIKPKDMMGIPWRVAFALQDDGWYLRQDIIWSKPNPMPESVSDRCTKSHEYIFLMTKSPRYYFDQQAIEEDVSLNTHARMKQDIEKQIGSARAHGGKKHNGNMKAVVKGSGVGWGYSNNEKPRTKGNVTAKKSLENSTGSKNNTRFAENVCLRVEKRNKRSVWEVTTQPFSGAHFATFPPKLIEPCILAGCPEGGIVLDPFFGAGTTGMVADRLGRNCIGIELNPEYVQLAHDRIAKDAGMFTKIEVIK